MDVVDGLDGYLAGQCGPAAVGSVGDPRLLTERVTRRCPKLSVPVDTITTSSGPLVGVHLLIVFEELVVVVAEPAR